MTNLRHAGAAIALICTLALGGCATAYYDTLEKFGYQKRELLVDRIADARDSQEKAKEQFSNALEQFRSVVSFDGGDLEAVYDRLNKEYQRSEDRAKDVTDRIDSVESVANALFKEWEQELDQYQSANLRANSERQLRETQTSYSQVLSAMRRAESKIDPVLRSLNDQVLYLKHNLNARAIASLQGEYQSISTEVDGLIREMESSIAEANSFIRSMEGQGG